jgi:hypothetical protein
MIKGCGMEKAHKFLLMKIAEMKGKVNFCETGDQSKKKSRKIFKFKFHTPRKSQSKNGHKKIPIQFA